MNEVTKLYENAGIKKINIHQSEIDNGDPRFTGISHSDSYIKHPPFTAEKQLNIIKWLLKNYDIGFSQLGKRIDTSLDGVNCISGLGSGNTFEESLVQAINDLWQDLTEEERKQIKEILE